MLPVSATLEIGDEQVSDLAAKLQPVLVDFVHAGTDRVGNGLFLLLGGPGKWAYPTVAEFAKILITAAAQLDTARVVELLLGWVSGEPLRFRTSALLEGVDIAAPLHLADGIRLSKLPLSSADLPASLPYVQMAAPVTDFMGGVVMSIDCEMSPALYLPEEDEVRRMPTRNGTFRLASDRIPNLSLDSFCESMSLACNGYVDWFVHWKDIEELEAFSSMQSGVSYKYRSHVDRTMVSQTDLSNALKIHHARHGGGGPKENLELAMSRWIRSKRSGTDLDKLIELRIALEALYEIGGLNEKGFRIATYGAWHLGKDFQERRECRETLRKVYDDSSRAVHGGKLKHAAKKPELVLSAQDICRNGILKRLEEREKPNWDEMILGAEE